MAHFLGGSKVSRRVDSRALPGLTTTPQTLQAAGFSEVFFRAAEAHEVSKVAAKGADAKGFA
jgi:hypothetical protein